MNYSRFLFLTPLCLLIGTELYMILNQRNFIIKSSCTHADSLIVFFWIVSKLSTFKSKVSKFNVSTNAVKLFFKRDKVDNAFNWFSYPSKVNFIYSLLSERFSKNVKYKLINLSLFEKCKSPGFALCSPDPSKVHEIQLDISQKQTNTYAIFFISTLNYVHI